jgi:putative ABC transport system substrate-binding protein
LNRRACRLFLIWGVVLITLVSIGGLAEAKTFVVGIVCQSPTMEPAIAGFKEAFDALIEHDEDASVTYIHNGYVSDVAAEVERLLSTGAVDLLLTLGTPATQAAQRATVGTGIPVVFTAVQDPVASGIVASMTQPGGNMTGVRAGGSSGKALQWLLEIAPGTRRLYVPNWPSDSASALGLADLMSAAGALGIDIVARDVSTTEELLATLADMPSDVDSVFLNSSGSLNAQVSAYVQAALSRKIPLASQSPLTGSGVLLTYGHDYYRDGVQAARLAHLVLHGAAPGDIPVETADFFLGINLQTAAAIGLVISDDVLDQADVIVR